MSYQAAAKNALALIDLVSPGPGAYTDANLSAVAQARTMLHRIANGSLVVSELPSKETATPGAEQP